MFKLDNFFFYYFSFLPSKSGCLYMSAVFSWKGIYLVTSEVVEAALPEHSSSWLHVGSERGTLQINGERSGSGAESCTLHLPLIALEPRNELNSRKSLPSIVELLLQMPGF